MEGATLVIAWKVLTKIHRLGFTSSYRPCLLVSLYSESYFSPVLFFFLSLRNEVNFVAML